MHTAWGPHGPPLVPGVPLQWSKNGRYGVGREPSTSIDRNFAGHAAVRWSRPGEGHRWPRHDATTDYSDQSRADGAAGSVRPRALGRGTRRTSGARHRGSCPSFPARDENGGVRASYRMPGPARSPASGAEKWRRPSLVLLCLSRRNHCGAQGIAVGRDRDHSTAEWRGDVVPGGTHASRFRGVPSAARASCALAGPRSTSASTTATTAPTTGPMK